MLSLFLAYKELGLDALMFRKKSCIAFDMYLTLINYDGSLKYIEALNMVS